jgi:hypothetical protein
VPEESLSFRMSGRAVALRLLISAAGAILVVYALLLQAERQWLEAAIGAFVCAAGLGDLGVPVYVAQEDGLLLVRKAYAGFDRMIRWSSIREVRPDGERRLAVRLADDSWQTLSVGSLSPADRERLRSEVKRRIGHG